MRDEYGHIWVRTDSINELIEIARDATNYIQELQYDVSRVRWVLLSTVLAMQGAMALQLVGYDGSHSSIISERHRKKYLTYLNNTPVGPVPDFKMADPKTLLKRVTNPLDLPRPYTVELSEDGKGLIEMVIDHRAEYSHFKPQGWSLEISGLPAALAECWTLVEQIVEGKCSFSHQFNSDQRDRLLVGVKRTLEEIDALQRHYDNM